MLLNEQLSVTVSNLVCVSVHPSVSSSSQVRDSEETSVISEQPKSVNEQSCVNRCVSLCVSEHHSLPHEQHIIYQ